MEHVLTQPTVMCSFKHENNSSEALLIFTDKLRTVCSERLILMSWFPEALASAATRLVLPTPGEPSSRMGLWSFSARKILMVFTAVVPAPRA